MHRNFPLILAFAFGCAPRTSATTQTTASPAETPAPTTTSTLTPIETPTGTSTPTPTGTPTPTAATPPALSDHDRLLAFLKDRLPSGDELVDNGPDSPPSVLHTVQRGEIPATLAHTYNDLSDVYFEADFATEIAKSARKEGGFLPGHKIHVPHLVTAAFKSADDERLGMPDDKVVKGLYIRGATATKPMFVFILDQMTKRDINAIVLDAKDYDGPVTYPSKVPLAIESGAAKGPPIHDLARVIRFVHSKGVRVIMRVSCFNDELMAHAHPEMIPLSKWGKPYQIGWLDPNNEQAQGYILDLVKESLDAGADEIELDYVRYPVLGIKGADFRLEEKKLTKIDVIHGFVKKAHAITQAHHVPLSLDLFGVVAQGRRIDIDMLGQDMAVLAPDAEAFSPMVYPSHYSTGFYGWENPGDHPEIVGIGVKGSLEQIGTAHPDDPHTPLAVVRPWMQAMNYKTTTYSPQYLKDEIRAAQTNGALGWLMWNPSQEYGYAWAAVPPKPIAANDKPSAPVAVAAAASAADKTTQKN